MSSTKTHIATADEHSITVRGRSLTADLMGKHTFTEMIYFLICGVMPTTAQTKVLDVCLVTLMEHGWTPASIISRLTMDSVPGESQVAIAAGLLAVGSVFAGTLEGCAQILAAGAEFDGDADDYCDRVVAHHRLTKTPLPGFGHRMHKPDDPRTPVILAVAAEAGCHGKHIDLLLRLGKRIDAAYGKHLTINATGAMAAALMEIGIPVAAMRGVAVVSRSGGLLGHIVEEQTTHAAREIWKLARENIPYEEPPRS